MISGDSKIRVHLSPENLGVLCIKISIEASSRAVRKVDSISASLTCVTWEKSPGRDAVEHDAVRDSRMLTLSFVHRRRFTI